jgi:hypothetical protein
MPFTERPYGGFIPGVGEIGDCVWLIGLLIRLLTMPGIGPFSIGILSEGNDNAIGSKDSNDEFIVCASLRRGARRIAPTDA